MRDLLDKLNKINESQILTEKSRGLLYRDPGDKFIQGPLSNPTATLTFQKAEYFPDMPGQYKDYDDLATEAQKIVLSYPGIQWVNSPNAGTLGFAILTLTDENNNEQYVGRFFKSITPDMTGSWKNNDLPGGWQLAKGSSIKSSYGLKPTDLFPGNATFDTPLALLNAIERDPKVKELMPGLQMLLGGRLPVFEGMADMISAIQDDLGEIIAPIALVQGLITDSGAEAAKRGLLPGMSWKGGEINFPSSKTNGLVDSYVTVDGVEVGISSKGKGGAQASIKNVADGIALATSSGTAAQKRMLTKYAGQIDILNQIANKSAIEFPITYAVEHGMITSRVGDHIRDLIKSGVKTLNQARINSVDQQQIKELIDTVGTRPAPSYSVGYHALTALARDVAAQVNEDPKFGEMCLYFVNINPIIQIYLTASKKGNDAVVTKITSLYPPNFQGTVLLSYNKSYFASGANGKMTFAYEPDKNAAAASVANAAADKKRAKKVSDQIEKIATGQTAPAVTARKERIAPSREKR